MGPDGPAVAGMRAPDAATSLPSVALSGAGAMALGLSLLCRRSGHSSTGAGRSGHR